MYVLIKLCVILWKWCSFTFIYRRCFFVCYILLKILLSHISLQILYFESLQSVVNSRKLIALLRRCLFWKYSSYSHIPINSRTKTYLISYTWSNSIFTSIFKVIWVFLSWQYFSLFTRINIHRYCNILLTLDTPIWTTPCKILNISFSSFDWN